jgi:hypothetical protein
VSAFWWPSWLKRPEPKPVNVIVHVKADTDPRKAAEAVMREMRAHALRNGNSALKGL